MPSVALELDTITPTFPGGTVHVAFVGSALWTTNKSGRTLTVDFRVRLLPPRRLVPLELHLHGDELSKADLERFPYEGLLERIRDWIVTDGAPRSRPVPGDPLGGWLPSHEEWANTRERFIGLVDHAASTTGVRRGRPVTLDDNYLATFGADYVRAGIEHPRDFHSALKNERSGGSIRRSIEKATEDGWLAESTAGSRRPPRPGARLLRKWADEGYPEWWPQGEGDR